MTVDRRQFLGALATAPAAYLLAGTPSPPADLRYLVSPHSLFEPVTLEPGEPPEFPLDLVFDHRARSFRPTARPFFLDPLLGRGREDRAGLDWLWVPTGQVMAAGKTASEAEKAHAQKLDERAGHLLLDAAGACPIEPATSAALYENMRRLLTDRRLTAQCLLPVLLKDGYLVGVRPGKLGHSLVRPIRVRPATFAGPDAFYTHSDEGMAVLDPGVLVRGRVK